jgi:hypothetical protein
MTGWGWTDATDGDREETEDGLWTQPAARMTATTSKQYAAFMAEIPHTKYDRRSGFSR